MIAARIGSEAEIRFLGDFAAGNLISERVAGEDWLRMAQLVATYRDLPLSTVDASVVAAAERLRVNQIATLDRRHFTVVRPSHIPAFELIPERHGDRLGPASDSDGSLEGELLATFDSPRDLLK